MSAVLHRTAALTEPVTVARALVAAGLSLRKAHEVLDRLTAGETVPVILPTVSDREDTAARLRMLGIALERRRPPDAVDVKAVRERLALTQAEFAARFGFELDTVQNWEQGRNAPDGPTRTLLRVIEQNPEAVENALGGARAA